MENQSNDFLKPENAQKLSNNPWPQQNSNQIMLPKAIGVMITGIAALPASMSYGIPGFICAGIALSMARTAIDAYEADPSRYKESSLKMVNAGKLCANIAMVLSVVFLIFWIWYFYWIFTMTSRSYHY